MLKTIGNALFSKIQNPKFIPGEKQGEDYEVRTYPAAKWVSTTTTGMDWDPAISTGFRRLFKYIQGANMDKVAVDMTAPVSCLVQPGAGPACESSFTVSFYVPEELQDAPPEPSDQAVFLESRKEFTGLRSRPVREGGRALRQVGGEGREGLRQVGGRDGLRQVGGREGGPTSGGREGGPTSGCGGREGGRLRQGREGRRPTSGWEARAYVRWREGTEGTTYGGFSNEQVKRENLLRLVQSLTRDGVSFQEQPYYTAGYDSPFKLTNRRNEVWILKKAEG
ncbi:unnamed protein product [Boreogadus saida]